MSIESARLFVQKVYTNQDFANKVTKIEDINELVVFASKTGFDFGADELSKVSQEFRNKTNVELSEEDLDMVAGGLPIYAPCTKESKSPMCI